MCCWSGQGATVDTARAEGRTIFGIFALLAEFERELISERTKAGIRAARRRGVHMARPAKLTPYQIDHWRELIAAEKETRAGDRCWVWRACHSRNRASIILLGRPAQDSPKETKMPRLGTDCDMSGDALIKCH